MEVTQTKHLVEADISNCFHWWAKIRGTFQDFSSTSPWEWHFLIFKTNCTIIKRQKLETLWKEEEMLFPPQYYFRANSPVFSFPSFMWSERASFHHHIFQYLMRQQSLLCWQRHTGWRRTPFGPPWPFCKTESVNPIKCSPGTAEASRHWMIITSPD